jgi:hypothetical protein
MTIKLNAALAKLQTQDQTASVREQATAQAGSAADSADSADSKPSVDTTTREKAVKFSPELMDKIARAGLDVGDVAAEPFVRIDPIFYKKNTPGSERVNPENLSAAATLQGMINIKEGK